jgi:uncharacterized protein affecting Mg2+/Co2+ transport
MKSNQIDDSTKQIYILIAVHFLQHISQHSNMLYVNGYCRDFRNASDLEW